MLPPTANSSTRLSPLPTRVPFPAAITVVLSSSPKTSNRPKSINSRRKKQKENQMEEKEEERIAKGSGSGGERKEKKKKKKKEEEEGALPLMALNHVSRLCRNVKESIDFYSKVLGFVPIERPQSFDFEGAWLFNYGVGIHLVQSEDEDRVGQDRDYLDPKDNHISFQCEDMEAMEGKLKELGVKYLKRTLEEEEEGGGESMIDQLFFNDPDGFMIEICNCENMKVVPAGSFGKIKLPSDRHTPPLHLNLNNGFQ